mgnify:CR=1 FL=1
MSVKINMSIEQLTNAPSSSDTFWAWIGYNDINNEDRNKPYYYRELLYHVRPAKL